MLSHDVGLIGPEEKKTFSIAKDVVRDKTSCSGFPKCFQPFFVWRSYFVFLEQDVATPKLWRTNTDVLKAQCITIARFVLRYKNQIHPIS